jgi:DNA-binding response OmpR family regulator
MSSTQLFIPDRVLREALLEQWNGVGLGAVAEGSDLAAALKSDAVSALILDEAVFDKKNLKLLSEAASDGKKKRLFLLGASAKDLDTGYITETFPKPLRLGHVLSRLQFYLQAAPRLNSAPVLFGPYRFEPQNRQVVSQENATVIRLTEKETALLEQLSQSDVAVTREELLASIWGYGQQIDTHTLETHIYQLRRKLDPQGTGANWLVNEQGAYRLNRGGAQ